MPIVVIYAFDRPEANKREAVAGITEVMCRTYRVRPENITVRIARLDPGKVAHGGVLVSDQDPGTAPEGT